MKNCRNAAKASFDGKIFIQSNKCYNISMRHLVVCEAKSQGVIPLNSWCNYIFQTLASLFEIKDGSSFLETAFFPPSFQSLPNTGEICFSGELPHRLNKDVLTSLLLYLKMVSHNVWAAGSPSSTTDTTLAARAVLLVATEWRIERCIIQGFRWLRRSVPSASTIRGDLAPLLKHHSRKSTCW